MNRTFVAWVAFCASLGIGATVAALTGAAAPWLTNGAAVVGLVGLLSAVIVGSARPDLQAFGPCLCRAVHPGRVALTIDDGPDPRSTPIFLAALADHHATATFFVLADRVRAYPALFRQILDGGHEVALHGLRHDPSLTVLSPTAGEAWLRAALAVLRLHGAPPVRWFRPPFGAISPRVFPPLTRVGLPLAWCSVRPGDGGPASAATILARCKAAVGTDIVLLHDGARHTPTLFRTILDEWASRGIRVTSLSSAMEPP